MEIKETDFTQDEIKLQKIADDSDHLYDKSHFYVITKKIIIDKSENTINKSFFKVFTYKNSLRLSILMNDAPNEKSVNWFVNEINKYINNTDKSMIMIEYAQRNGFTDILTNKFENYQISNNYRCYYIDHDEINPIVDMKGLKKHHCTEDMIDTCIEILEDIFTPFPDSPGSFREDKNRITNEFLNTNGGTDLFYKDDILIGLCGHIQGCFTETCVRKEFQGNGYGEVIVRSTLQSIYEMGYNAKLFTGSYNKKAISLYEKVGFKKLYEANQIKKRS